MSFRTSIEVLKSEPTIRYDSNLLFVGSCFSVEIGKKLSDLKYNVLQNPAGITFNPKSILTTIRACTSGNSLPEEDLFFHNGLWKHSDFHSSYNHPDKETCVENINHSISKAHKYISSISHLTITLGSAYTYEDIISGRIVNNCHKRPSQDFNKRLLSIEEIKESLESIFGLISQYSDKKVKFIITVSPVRHIKDGIIENQRSKARLIEAAHLLIEDNNNVHYFPAYELLLDDLRDYRFYGRDLVHPSHEAIDYIYEKFEQACLHQIDFELRTKIAHINRSLSHRSQFPGTDEHRTFVAQLINQMRKLMEKYPGISYNKEISALEKDI